MPGSGSDNLPSLEECMAIYSNIYRQFDGNEFNIEEFSRKLQRGDDGDSEFTQDQIIQYLDLLVAYGLLDYRQNNRYTIRCSPAESIESWKSKTISRIERLYVAVGDEGLSYQNIEPDSSGGETLTYDNDTYARISLTEETGFDVLLNTIKDILSRYSEIDGVVLSSPGDLSGKVQQFVDKISESSEINSYTFEKVMTDLVGENKDNLEFHAFLRIKE